MAKTYCITFHNAHSNEIEILSEKVIVVAMAMSIILLQFQTFSISVSLQMTINISPLSSRFIDILVFGIALGSFVFIHLPRCHYSHISHQSIDKFI